MAFAAFADAPVDVAVLEVGLGGAWDATNVVEAATCVVLPVGLDHVPLLGTTLAEIATEKAGIIHRGRHRRARPAAARGRRGAAAPLRRGRRDGRPRGAGVRRRRAAHRRRRAAARRCRGSAGRYDDVYLPLHGAHQAANAAAALAAVEAFLGGGDKGRSTPTLVREGFARVASPGPARGRPHLADRAARRRAQPAHGMTATVAALADAFAFTHLVAVVAVLGDKDVLRHARGARAGRRLRRRHPERLAARDAGRRPADLAARRLRRGPRAGRGPPRRRARHRRRRWPRPRRSTAAPACSSPARSSPSARPARCCVR